MQSLKVVFMKYVQNIAYTILNEPLYMYANTKLNLSKSKPYHMLLLLLLLSRFGRVRLCVTP